MEETESSQGFMGERVLAETIPISFNNSRDGERVWGQWQSEFSELQRRHKGKGLELDENEKRKQME